jgi:hypothetical protein
VAELLELAFDSGRMHEAQRIGEAAADLDAAWRAHGQATREQRVADRAASMRSADPDWLGTSAAQLRERDRQQLEIGLRLRPLGDDGSATGWRQIRPRLSDAVWLRIWYDLGVHTREQLDDLAPAPPTLGGAA